MRWCKVRSAPPDSAARRCGCCACTSRSQTRVLEMLAGAMRELRVGAPHELATDVGPVIDAEAHANLTRHVQRLEREARAAGALPGRRAQSSTHIAPVAFEIDTVEALREEVFGPVLHVVR